MSELTYLINLSAWFAVCLSLGSAYLKLNKIWKRRHQAEVARSVSIMGNLLDVLPLALLSANYLMISQWQGLLDGLIWILTGLVMIGIGTGYWVEGRQPRSLWALLRHSLALEGREISTLARLTLHPPNADLTIRILAGLAFVDNHLDPRERKYIETFASSWRIDLDWEAMRHNESDESGQRVIDLHCLFEEYLATSPPGHQVSQLFDVVGALAGIDESMSQEEATLMGEVEGLVLSYLTGEGGQEGNVVTVVPQSEEQTAEIEGQLSALTKTRIAGGVGYVVNSFFSRNYAELVCRQYRELGFLTVTVEDHLVANEKPVLPTG